VKKIWTGCDSEIDQIQELELARGKIGPTKSGTRHEEKVDPGKGERGEKLKGRYNDS
jgi:hypothetical protein